MFKMFPFHSGPCYYEPALLLMLNCPRTLQGICVVNNFKGVHSAAAKLKTEDYRGLPLMTFPRVESPLETLSAQVPANT